MLLSTRWTHWLAAIFHHGPSIEQQAKNERVTEAYEFLERAPALARNPAVPQEEHALSGHDTLSVDAKEPRVFHPSVSKKKRSWAHFWVKSGLLAFFSEQSGLKESRLIDGAPWYIRYGEVYCIDTILSKVSFTQTK